MKKLFIGWLSGLFLLAFSSQGATIYVKSNASGVNSGASWANAYTNLQPAIDSAVSGDRVWVAAGTYKPSSWPNGGAGERYKHFSLKNGVAIYGGFSGIESNLTDRNIDTNKVICSGDIGIAGNNSDNCYQVFYHPYGTGLDNTAVLDGVTISGGNANGSSPYNFGGGMYNSGCSPSIIKCTFISNVTSASGGAMYNYGCAPIVSYCSFFSNSAVDGGGIYNSNSSSTSISGSFFSANTASASGGGIFNTDSNPSVVNNTFASNTAVNGGGIYNYFSFPALNNCTFTGNTASSNGGGIYCQYNSASTPVFTVKNCIFWNNGGSGKEIYKASITASVSYCVVQGGFTGGTNIITTDPLLYTPCLNGGFTNTCAITNASSAIFIPKTAVSNTWNGSSSYDQRGSARAPSASRAAGAYEPSYGYPSILTTAVSGITKTSAVSGVSFLDSGSGYTVTQKGVCWSTTSGPTINDFKTTDGAGIASSASNIAGLTEDTDYYLRAYAQLNDGTVIYGQEIQFKSLMVYYVVVGGAGNIDGTSWGDALADFQVAINMASSGDEVWVAQGIYKPQSWPNGGSIAREKHFSLKKGVGVYGGFVGNEIARAERDFTTNVTTFSGDIGNIGDNSDNCYHVFYHPNGLGLDNGTIIDGFTISSGYINTNNTESNCGAGIYNDTQSMQIANCIFINNSIVVNITYPVAAITNAGAAIYNKNSNVNISACVFNNNSINAAAGANSTSCAAKGGAVFSSGGSVTYSFCIFDTNSLQVNYSSQSTARPASAFGGAICNENVNSTINSCLFKNNSTKGIRGDGTYNPVNCGGGAVYIYGTSPIIENSTFVENSANAVGAVVKYGGAIYNNNSSSLINSCTFNNNTAIDSGGAIYNAAGNPNVKNSLMWGNGGAGKEINSGTVTYCVVQGDFAGGSNIVTSDPQLQALADNGGYTQTIAIPGNSSAVAIPQYAGSNDWNGAPYLDQRGYGKRISGVRAIGAYDPNSKASFAVNFSSGANGSLSGTTSQTVAPMGSSTSVTAVPNTNYTLSGWTGDYTGTANPLTLTNVVKDMSVTANFALKTYTVSFVPGTSGGSIGGTATQTIQHGSSCTAVNPVPNPGYHFTGWTGDYTGNDNPLTISNVTRAMTINANFAINTYTVQFASGGNGSLTGTNPQTIEYGANCTAMTPVPATGYHFVNWTGDYSGTQNPLTLTNITANKSVTANFAINTYTVTFDLAGKGTRSGGGALSQTINHGSGATAPTVTPNAGWTFTGWDKTFNNITGNTTVTALYAVTTYTVTFVEGANGTITGTKVQTVNHGSSSSGVTAVPSTGYHFVNWTGSVTSTSNPLTVSNVTGVMTITANFAINTYSLQYAAGSNGTLTGTASQTVNYGANGTAVTAVPNTGYHFVKWSDDVMTESRTDTNITSNKSVTATFAINTYTVTFVEGANGTITGTKSQTVNHGAGCTAVTAVPATNYHFVDWTGDYSGTTNPLTISNVTANKTITANFAHNTATLTVSKTGNGTAGFTGTNPLNTATSTAILATPDTNNHFVNWTVTSGLATIASTAAASTTVTLNGGHSSAVTVTANFAIDQYTLTYTAGANGAVTGTSPQTVNHGSNGTSVTAVASTGYHFTGWSDGVMTESRTDTNITANLTVAAIFAINTYTVTFDLEDKGARTGGGDLSQTINHGGAATAPTVSANAGWIFNGWDNTFGNITSSQTVKAKWIVGPPVINDPGMQKTMVGVPFTLLLAVASESSPVNSVTVTGLPTGLKFDAKTMKITGVPTAATSKTVTVTAKNDSKTPAVLTFSMTVDLIPVWAYGTFNGSCVVNNDSGAATMTVTALGKVTGKLSAGGVNYAFSSASYARRDEEGAFWISTDISVNKADVPLTFKVKNTAGVVPATLSVAEGWLADEAIGEAAVKMYRNVWKDAGMAVILDPYIGYYTAVLPGGATFGSGYLAITVDKAGAVKTTGKLADGTVLSLSGTLIIDETGRVFTVIYTSPVAYKGGCLFGIAEFAKHDNPADGDKIYLRLLDDALFIWENRNPQATGVYGDGGFDRDLGLVGGWYDKTGNLYDYYQGKDLTVGADVGAPDPVLNIGVNHYTSDWWDSSGIAILPVLSKTEVMTGLSVVPKAGLPVNLGNNNWNYDAEENTVGLKIGLTRATGIFKGSFKAWFDYDKTHTSRNILYEGVMTPERQDKEDGNEGRGFYLWADKAQYQNPQGKTVSYPFNWSYDFLLLVNQ